MKTPVMRSVLAVLTIAGLSLSQSQQMALSEVNISGSDQWIELQNLTAASQDISSWTLYLATRSVGMPQNYFYGFPSGTVVPANGLLRVHWLQPIQSPPIAGELSTGTSILNFLFGLGAEPLQTISALGLFRSQVNNQMNTPSIIEDWVSWGDGNLRREDLAAQNGRWVLGRFLSPTQGNETFARATQAIGAMASKELEWFHDNSPTPGAVNAAQMSLAAIGAPCSAPGNHLLGPANLRVASLPVCGNRDFGYTIANTSGLLGEFVALVFSAAPAPINQPPLLPPTAGPRCPEYLSYNDFIGSLLVGATPGATTIPHDLSNLPISFRGMRVVLQAVVLDAFTPVPPYQGTSNGIDFVIGG
jgi:hypothetical protein